MDVVPTCSICGMEPENTYHAMNTCTKACALRQYLEKDWTLPPREMFRNSGDDWVLILLSQVDEFMRAKLLLLWWRCWHLRNNIIFGDGKDRVDHSALFLQSYLTVIQDNRDIEALVDEKGKLPIANFEGHNATKRKEIPVPWSKPSFGWAKLNFDASFHEEENEGAWDAILRDEYGEIILSVTFRTR